MCDDNLRNLIGSVVAEFVRDGALFTALDVSNKVKETMPMARHREIRDEVRSSWLTDIEPNSYGRSPVTVNLADGSTAEALLYHPLVDSWDLDTKYDAQQRSKTSMYQASDPITNAINVTNQPVASNKVNVNIAPISSNKIAPVQVNARDLWNNLFQVQPSLFPRR